MGYEQIPEELQRLRQWVCWRVEERRGKPTKAPVNARSKSGQHASSTDPSTWSSFAAAVKRAERDASIAGIGFVFTTDDPYVGIDIDRDHDDDAENALDLIAQFDTYAEWSPSGAGVHLIGRATLPDGKGRHPKGIGVFAHGRFFTMTGRAIDGHTAVADIQTPLDRHWPLWFPPRVEPLARPTLAWSAADDEVLDRCRSAKNAGKFIALYDHGDTAPYQNNESEADLALMSLLAFYTQDPAQLDRLFRASARYRAKWEREDYRDMTISRALERSEFYEPPTNTASGITVYRSSEAEAREIDPETGEILEHPAEMGENPAETVDFRTFNCSDKGNAQRFVHHVGDRARFAARWGTWLVWDGTRWAPDELNAAQELAKSVVEGIYAEADRVPEDDKRKKLSAWAIQSESGPRIREMLRLAASDPAISVAVDRLDRDPLLLNVQNGTVDLRTGELRPHAQGDAITKLAPWVYDPDATCPTWDRFLDQIMAKRPSLIEFLQRAVGYSLTGIVNERVMFLLHGDSTTGKSTFLDTVHEMLGDYALRSPNELMVARRSPSAIPTEVASLAGVRFTFVSETGEFDRMDEAKVKDLVSGDPLRARMLHQNPFTFLPQFKLWAGTNHKPSVRSADNAIWNRIRLVPFDVVITPDRIDRSLPEKLRAEMPGILAWAVRGCLAWQKVGMVAPETVTRVTQEYRESMDLVGAFIAEECVTKDGTHESVTAMYAAYKEWADASGERPMTKKMLSLRLAERGYPSVRVGRDNRTVYQNVRLRTSTDPEPDFTPELQRWAEQWQD